MKLSWNVITQLIGTAIQGLNAAGSVLPPAYNVPIALGIAAVQSIVALISHFKNPDGTSAKTAYIPPPSSSI